MPIPISRVRLGRTAIVVLCMIAVCAGAVSHASLSAEHTTGLPRPVLLPADPDSERAALDWLERRVQRDPEDIMALNMLGSRYLQRMRETGNAAYLQLAAKAAHASLTSVAAGHNSGALNLLTQVEFATHDFSAARDHARLLAQLAPKEAYPYQILGD